MKRSRFQHDRVLRIGLAFCVVGLPLLAWPQAGISDRDKDDDTEIVTSIDVFPKLHGDVELSIAVSGADTSVDLVPLIRTSLGCDWRGPRTAAGYVTGTCRQLLASHRGAVNDTLRLAPLADALSKAGLPPVNFELTTAGEPVSPSDALWIPESKSGKSNKSRDHIWVFRASAASPLPSPFAIHFGTPWEPGRLVAPLLFVLFGPAMLALWVRRQMARKNAGPNGGVIWLNWILLGSWLCWISAVRVEDLGGAAASIGLDNPVLTLIIGTLLFALPPLFATTSSLLVLAPQAGPDTPRGQLMGMLRRTLTAEATFVIPMGLFLVGTTTMENEWRMGMLSMVAAYTVYRLLGWCSWRFDTQFALHLFTGELVERSVAIAQAAQVDLKGVYLLENRYPSEANAFAMSGGRISFTRGLIENMSRREVDAVIAHEVGHLRGKHIGMRTGLFIAYLVVIGPAVGTFLSKAGLPGWVMALPVAPMLYVLLAGQLSQKNELNADSRAVELTKDPEGTIAALARLVRLTRSPVDWGGMQGSILSHPSMQKRVLAVARRFGVAQPRALELLHNPDTLNAAVGQPADSRYPLPEFVERAKPVFTGAARMSHAYWTPWIFGGMLIALLMLVAYAAAETYNLERGPFWSVAIFFLSLPLVGWLTLRLDDWWDCLFIRRMRRRVEARTGISTGTPVALTPGDRVMPFESQFAWDLGRLALDAERLSYQGEQTQFSILRSEVTAMEVHKSRSGWCRTYAVVVRSGGSAFSLRLADRGRTRRLARKLEAQLNAWWRAEQTAPALAVAEPLPAPSLPPVRPTVPSRWRVAWVFGVRTVLLFLATIFLFSNSPAMDHIPLFALVPFTAPVLYAVVVCPSLLRPE